MTKNRASPPAVYSGERPTLGRPKFGTLLHSDPSISLHQDEEQSNLSRRNSNASAGVGTCSGDDASPLPYNFMSPWSQPSPYKNSPWIRASPLIAPSDYDNHTLIGSIVREEGHVYSIAASGNLLYTGSDSKNIRVWKNMKEYLGFKTSSGLVKAIVISGGRIFTGHQDGKIRVWRFSVNSKSNPYRRVGSLPTTRDFIRSSMNPKNYVQVRRHKSVPWIRHYDAVSCLSLDEDRGIIYSGSWDKSVKVWRISDSKCLESINAHSDAVNSVAVGFDGLVFTGSADGTIKVWRRELVGKATQHVLVRLLLEQDNAVTAVGVDKAARVVYGSTSDGLVQFWVHEKHTLGHGGVLRGHKIAVLCLATAGSLVVSGSADRSICVWRREEGGDHALLSVLTGHTGPVKCLAIEEDQDAEKGDQRWIVYSGSLDRSVKVWRVSERTHKAVEV